MLPRQGAAGCAVKDQPDQPDQEGEDACPGPCGEIPVVNTSGANRDFLLMREYSATVGATDGNIIAPS